MADKKPTELTTGTSVDNSDYVEYVDVSDTTDDASGTSKKVTKANLIAGLQAEPSEGAFVDGDKTKLDAIETAATADQTGAEIKSLYEAESDTNAFTDADHSKLDGIEASADVTDATNVNAAGATMNTDTNVSANSWVLDEDTLSSDDATKVPTQQSVKAYVDANTGGSPEGTAVLSTGETGGSKFLREDGDGTSSWQAIPGGGDMLSTSNLSDLANAGTSRTNLGVAIGSDVQAYSAVLDGTTASFTTADETKLDAIEAAADVTDTTNVTAAGALMDSEVTNLAQVKAFDTTDYATAAQGTTADSALQPNTAINVTEIDYDTADGEVTALGNLGSTEVIDFSNGTYQTGNLDANCTITHSNEVTGRGVTLVLSYSGAQRTLTWSHVDEWLDNTDGSAPTAPAASGDVLIVSMKFIGSTCYASATGNYAVYS